MMKMLKNNSSHAETDRKLAAPMFWLGVLFLLLLAGFLQGANSLTEPQPGDPLTVEEITPEMMAEAKGDLSVFWEDPWVFWCGWGMVLLYPCFIAEAGYHLFSGSPFKKRLLLYCLIPPARIGAPNHVDGKSVWLPKLGQSQLNDELYDRVEKGATFPMIGVVLLILPLLAIEHVWKDAIPSHPLLAFSLHFGDAFIWFAFTFEFIVMLHVVEKKLQYCKTHWLDIAIILLPLVQFLRAMRLGRLLRLQQLTQLGKMTRLYNMRGLIMRMWRAVLFFKVIDRVLRGTPEKQLAKLRLILSEKESEINDLKCQIELLEQSVAEENAPSTPLQTAELPSTTTEAA